MPETANTAPPTTMPVSDRGDGSLLLRPEAVLGDMRGRALVVSYGAIDWPTVPVMDAAPICTPMLGPVGGGSIELKPAIPYEVSRRYLDPTMVLEGMFTTAAGTARVTDSLNRGSAAELPWSELARRVQAASAQVPMRWAVRAGHGLIEIRPWAGKEGGQIRVLAGERRLARVTDGVGAPRAHVRGIEGEFVARGEAPALPAVVATPGGQLCSATTNVPPGRPKERPCCAALSWTSLPTSKGDLPKPCPGPNGTGPPAGTRGTRGCSPRSPTSASGNSAATFPRRSCAPCCSNAPPGCPPVGRAATSQATSRDVPAGDRL